MVSLEQPRATICQNYTHHGCFVVTAKKFDIMKRRHTRHGTDTKKIPPAIFGCFNWLLWYPPITERDHRNAGSHSLGATGRYTDYADFKIYTSMSANALSNTASTCHHAQPKKHKFWARYVRQDRILKHVPSDGFGHRRVFKQNATSVPIGNLGAAIERRPQLQSLQSPNPKFCTLYRSETRSSKSDFAQFFCVSCLAE